MTCLIIFYVCVIWIFISLVLPELAMTLIILFCTWELLTWTQVAFAASNKQSVITVPAIEPIAPPLAIKWTAPSVTQKPVSFDPETLADQLSNNTEDIIFYETWDVFQNFGKKGN